MRSHYIFREYNLKMEKTKCYQANSIDLFFDIRNLTDKVKSLGLIIYSILQYKYAKFNNLLEIANVKISLTSFEGKFQFYQSTLSTTSIIY